MEPDSFRLIPERKPLSGRVPRGNVAGQDGNGVLVRWDGLRFNRS